MANKVLSFIRNIFARDNNRAEDSPEKTYNRYYSVGGSGANYGAMYSPGMNQASYNDGTTMQEDLLTRYADYEDLDEIAELSTALDIISDNATQSDHISGRIVHVECEDNTIKELLEECFYTNLRIDETIWEMCRTMCKYGQNFEEHVVTEEQGIIDLNYLAPPQIRRIEDEDGSLLGFIYDKSGQFQISTEEFAQRLEDRELNQQKYLESGRQTQVFEDWEVTHFRLMSKYRGSVYGWSFLEAARWTAKRLLMLEDAAIIYKISRAAQRFVFKVDVGDLPPREAFEYVNQVKKNIKKAKYINENGKLDLTSNPMTNTEDFFIPVRKDKASMEIEDVGGFDSSFYMDDIEYFKDKLYAAIKIPKDYLNYSEDSVSKANLCLVPETKIPLLDGRTVFMEDLIKEHSQGKQNYVYSIDEHGFIKAGKITNALWTRKNAEVIRVHLDSDTYFDCTPDHPVMNRDGKYIKAEDLRPGDVLMPYRDKLNHTVSKIEVLTERRDTCDITVDKYHNFALTCGVIVHNSTEDINFARTVIRVQRNLRTGLINIGRVHLAALGHDPDGIEFDIYLSAPSTIFEMAMMEVRQAQLDIAENYREFVDDYWIMTNILKFSDEEYEEIKKRLKDQQDDPFSENRFPTVESRSSKRKMKKEVEKILNDIGEEALLKDKGVVGKRLNELREISEDLKRLLSKK